MIGLDLEALAFNAENPVFCPFFFDFQRNCSPILHGGSEEQSLNHLKYIYGFPFLDFFFNTPDHYIMVMTYYAIWQTISLRLTSRSSRRGGCGSPSTPPPWPWSSPCPTHSEKYLSQEAKRAFS